jgi:hypothetical protein
VIVFFVSYATFIYREGGALNNLGIALLRVRRFDEAISALQDAATDRRACLNSSVGAEHYGAYAADVLVNLGAPYGPSQINGKHQHRSL